VLIITEGTAKLDNHKYKSLFHIKAKMIPYDEVEAYVGHAPGGVCPFGVNEGVAVYLDESLRKFDTVLPGSGQRPHRSQADLAGAGSSRRSRGLGGCLQGAGRRVKRVHPAVLLLDGSFYDSQSNAGNIDSVLQT
jgi:hypothetical protein